jgi:hypothetical protein
MICHHTKHISVHHIDTIPLADLSKWSIRLYTASYSSLLHKKSPDHEFNDSNNWKLTPLLIDLEPTTEKQAHGSVATSSNSATNVIPLSTIEANIIDISDYAESGDKVHDSECWQRIPLWRQTQCHLATTRSASDNPNANDLPNAIMGIDDEICDYLATLWMNQSTLEPRSVRVEPYQVSIYSCHIIVSDDHFDCCNIR